jgi:hypothetical protein
MAAACTPRLVSGTTPFKVLMWTETRASPHRGEAAKVRVGG